MLERACAKGGQSPEMEDAGKEPESRRWCSPSRRQCIFLVLLLAVLLLFYNTDLKSPDWSATNWFISYRSRTHKVSPPNKTGSDTGSPGSEPAGLVTVNPHNESITSHTKSVTPPPVTLNKIKTPIPVPYESPGPWLVEYPYKYNFVLNEPKKCEEREPFLVLMVPVAPHNRADRDAIRSTWGGEGLVLGKVVTLLFLLGMHTGDGARELQEQVRRESGEHRDLIQSDFLDCYKNLTIKTMVMLEWLDSHCQGASYAMKIDSDMFLNVPNLINMLANAPKSNYMTGLVATGAAVSRDQGSKWFLPREIYPWSQYPRYALGLGYVLSLDLPKKLVEASRHVKALYIEDVHLGLCMKHLGIPFTDPPNYGYFHVFPVDYSRCAYSGLVATTLHPHTDLIEIWKDFKKPGPYC